MVVYGKDGNSPVEAVRSFIAVNLSPEVHKKLDEISGQLRQRLPGPVVRWVAVQNIHLTLKFLGDVSLSNLEVLKNLIRSQANTCPAHTIQVGGLGAFPTPQRARVIWVGVQIPQELKDVQRRLDEETARLGYPAEERGFSPHLTLGRVGRNCTPQELRKVADVLGSLQVGPLGETLVDCIHLYRSDLRPGGSVYTSLFAAPLAGARQASNHSVR